MSMLMLDLETMGNNSNSAIVSIGAIHFDEQGLKVDEFYECVDLQSCIDAGLKIDGSTVMWWLRQSNDARFALDVNAVSLKSALEKFAGYYVKTGAAEVWGNGCMFDNTILGNAFKAMGMDIPWKFWNDRCYRTMKNMYPQVEMKRVGEHHNALDDAKSQALHLIEILNLIKGDK